MKYLSIFIRVALLALGQSLDCHNASEVSLMDMGKSVNVQPQQSTAQQKPCAYFLGYTVLLCRYFTILHKLQLIHWYSTIRCYTFIQEGYTMLGTGVKGITVMPPWARWRLKSPACRLFTQSFVQAQIKQTSKPRATGLWEGNSPVTGELPAHVSIWWSYHGRPNIFESKWFSLSCLFSAKPVSLPVLARGWLDHWEQI